MGKNKHGKKAEIKIENPGTTETVVTIVLPSPEPEVKAENSLENSQIQECPSDACQELQDVWVSGKGCHNPESKYCVACANDFMATAIICQLRTIEAQAKAVEKKSTPAPSTVIKEGFGHRKGTQAAGIDQILQEGGGTPAAITQLLKDRGYNRNNLDDDDLWRRVLTHFSDLKRCHNMTIKKVNGSYSVAA